MREGDAWERDGHTNSWVYKWGKKTQSFPVPLHTHEHTLYPHSVRVTLMELIWETSVALPGRGIYWQGESQTQSITLPVCPIISHMERWPTKINWLFHKNNTCGKTMCCLQSETTFLHSIVTCACVWRAIYSMCHGDSCSCILFCCLQLVCLLVYLKCCLLCPVSQRLSYLSCLLLLSQCFNWSPDFARLPTHLHMH